MKNIFIILLLGIFTPVFAQVDSVALTEEIYTYVEQMPDFKGGEAGLLKYFSHNFKLPEGTNHSNIQSTKIVVSCIVETDGNLSNIQILKSISPVFDQQFVALLKATNGMWNPGKHNDVACRVSIKIPLMVELE